MSPLMLGTPTGMPVQLTYTFIAGPHSRITELLLGCRCLALFSSQAERKASTAIFGKFSVTCNMSRLGHLFEGRLYGAPKRSYMSSSSIENL